MAKPDPSLEMELTWEAMSPWISSFNSSLLFQAKGGLESKTCHRTSCIRLVHLVSEATFGVSGSKISGLREPEVITQMILPCLHEPTAKPFFAVIESLSIA